MVSRDSALESEIDFSVSIKARCADVMSSNFVAVTEEFVTNDDEVSIFCPVVWDSIGMIRDQIEDFKINRHLVREPIHPPSDLVNLIHDTYKISQVLILFGISKIGIDHALHNPELRFVLTQIEIVLSQGTI